MGAGQSSPTTQSALYKEITAEHLPGQAFRVFSQTRITIEKPEASELMSHLKSPARCCHLVHSNRLLDRNLARVQEYLTEEMVDQCKNVSEVGLIDVLRGNNWVRYLVFFPEVI